ncbi:MAG: hypothetical protein JO095_09775, partial [Alphaproteobacteria bacterium]|nr:hypothetical protein [Alphaproteobacteria bacterium]
MLWVPNGKLHQRAARGAELVIRWVWPLILTTGLGWFTATASAERLPLGAVYAPQATTFAVWSPDSDDVKLLLEDQEQTIPMRRIPDTDQYSDVYRVTVPGDHNLKRYNFVISGKRVRDPYGVMVEPATDNNVVMDLSQTEPQGGWVALPPLAQREDAVIYELNVHDYTADPSSGVSPGKRGKFLG